MAKVLIKTLSFFLKVFFSFWIANIIFSPISTAQNNDLHFEFYESHTNYIETSIKDLHFKHETISPIIEELKTNAFVKVEQKGTSVEGRSIHLIKVGSGKTKVLLWSQMHGDEPTATLAILDLFRYFSDQDAPHRNQLLRELSIYMVPLLNPDGAERFERNNAQDIDLNRDALQTKSPEAKILKNLIEEVDPDFAFNLHDQHKYYATGNSPYPASFSFLAPALNNTQGLTSTRENSMRLILSLNEFLQKKIPNQVARYKEQYEPNAFGEYCQSKNISTILIEVGSLRGDPEKQQLRKLQYTMLLIAFEQIASRAFETHRLESYYALPENKPGLFELIIRNAAIHIDGRLQVVDIGYKEQKKKTIDNYFYNEGYIEKIGDLSTSFGFDEIDANNFTIEKGKIYPKLIESVGQLNRLNFEQLAVEGYTTILCKSNSLFPLLNPIPFAALVQSDKKHYTISNKEITPLVLKKDGRIKYIAIKGKLYPYEKWLSQIRKQ